MEDLHSDSKSLSHLIHSPTYLLMIGYPVFWLEIFFHRQSWGITWPLAVIIYSMAALWIVFRGRKILYEGIVDGIASLGRAGTGDKLFLITAVGLAGMILAVSFQAYLLPPHLSQEYDALNYHLTIPRQHLILNSFQHIPWSTADLFLLPIDFALAPYWLATGLPNKIPQFIFLLGLAAVAWRLTLRLAENDHRAGILVVLAILGSHCFGIQMGTAMLDIALCYLFIAALDSFISGAVFLSAVEFTFYFWSKSFIPPQTVLVVFVLGILIWFLRKIGFKALAWDFIHEVPMQQRAGYKGPIKKFLAVFFVLSIFIGGPFVGKSIVYSGTPLYPFSPGLISPLRSIDKLESLKGAAQVHMTTKDQYGHGRGPWDFIKHFWLASVPEKGVNNTFDYPLGLMFLVFLGPFAGLALKTVKSRRIPLLPLLAVIFWLSWWMGSQQARFLYVPLVLIYISVATGFKFQSGISKCAVFLALLLTAVSVSRAHKPDWGKSSWEVLREKDKRMIEQSREHKAQGRMQPVRLEFHDAPFAQFPVQVIREKWPYVIAVQEAGKN